MSGTHEDVRSVAVYQKGILVCILVYLCVVFGQFLIPPQLRLLAVAGILVVGLAATVFVFLLAMKVYQPVLGIFMAILTMVPCIGLIMLLVINGKATAILQANGHKVGLMGANLSEF